MKSKINYHVPCTVEIGLLISSLKSTTTCYKIENESNTKNTGKLIEFQPQEKLLDISTLTASMNLILNKITN